VQEEIERQRARRRTSSGSKSANSTRQTAVEKGLEALADGMIAAAKIKSGPTHSDAKIDALIEESRNTRELLQKSLELSEKASEQASEVNAALLEFLKRK